MSVPKMLLFMYYRDAAIGGMLLISFYFELNEVESIRKYCIYSKKEKKRLATDGVTPTEH